MDIRPSTDYHSAPVKAINLAAAGQPAPELAPEALLATAQRETGLDDFGDMGFVEALQILHASIASDAAANPFGLGVARNRALGALKNRLWAEACFAAHPEIRQRKLGAPLVIVGPHRSGTTRLHSMLATDGRLRHLKAWEGINPAPRPGLPDGGRAQRHAEVKAALEARDALYPGAYLAHPMHADWPEEEMLLLNQSFAGFTPLGMFHVPDYYRWFKADAKHHAYRNMADLMRLLDWAGGVPEGQPWLLKNPQHMMDLGSLLTVFPDARLVFTHRDPIKTVGSTLSLMWLYSVQHTDAPCRAQVRDIWLDFCEESARRSIEARRSIAAGQQMDVYYEDVNRDWRSVMRHIYDFAGLPFTLGVEQTMAAWLTSGETEGKHGSHRYALEDFGTNSDEVDARLKFARDIYQIPYESHHAKSRDH